jgi:long-chain acyl-CoA synthetase
VILFTSGTTGLPKGVLLSHAACLAAAETFSSVCELDDTAVLLMFMPASYVIGQVMLHVTCLLGATLSLLRRFTPQDFCQTVERDRVSFFIGVPTAGEYLLAYPDSSLYDLSSLRKAVFGGAPVQPEFAARIKTFLGVDFYVGYGLTEATPLSFITPDQPLLPHSIGKPARGTVIRIVDEAGLDAPVNTPGEILVTSPCLCDGYLDLPEQTARRFQDGWFRTGDLGQRSEEGIFFLFERMDDAIKTSGYFVYPAEIERVLMSHPAVAEAAVVGAPHRQLGELVQAFVVLRPDASVTARQLSGYCRQRLSNEKRPRRIVFCSNLPKNSSGKILRRVLRDEIRSDRRPVS